MICIDQEEGRYLTIAVETSHRTTISITNEEGLELYAMLRERYGNIESGPVPVEIGKKPGFFARLFNLK